MKYPLIEIGRGPEEPGGFIEAMSETAVALAIAAAICVGVINLAVHLDEARSARAPTVEAAATPSGSIAATGTAHAN